MIDDRFQFALACKLSHLVQAALEFVFVDAIRFGQMRWVNRVNERDGRAVFVGQVHGPFQCPAGMGREIRRNKNVPQGLADDALTGLWKGHGQIVAKFDQDVE